MATANPGPEPQNNDSSDNNSPGSGKDEEKEDAEVSMCGHLFCWPCLHQWLETRPNRQICPVCKAESAVIKLCPSTDETVTKKILEINLFHQGQGVKDQN